MLFVHLFFTVQDVQAEGKYAIDSPGSPIAPEIPPEEYSLSKYLKYIQCFCCYLACIVHSDNFELFLCKCTQDYYYKSIFVILLFFDLTTFHHTLSCGVPKPFMTVLYVSMQCKSVWIHLIGDLITQGFYTTEKEVKR